MPRFDLKDRTGPDPVKTILHPGGRERVFDLPYDTDDPADIALLRKHPLLVERETPVPEPEPEPPPELALPKPPKSSRKEVDDQ